MSQPTSIHRQHNATRFEGLPLWLSVAALYAVTATAAGISVMRNDLGVPFLLLFGVAAVILSALVVPRGIFFTVTSVPFSFACGVVLAAWGINRAISTGNAGAFSTTTIATSFLPLAQLFPWMAGISAVVLLIGWGRLAILKRQAQVMETRAAVQRSRTAEQERRNRALSATARKRSNQVTVSELLARREADTRQQPRPSSGSTGSRPYDEFRQPRTSRYARYRDSERDY